MSRVSAIVVTYRTGNRLKECLYALSTDPEIHELVIVNHGNPEPVSDWISDYSAQRDNVALLRGHGNIGFGAGVNLGVSVASGDHLLIINPDAVLKRGSVSAVLSVAKDLSEPWIIGGKIFDIRGREERGPRRLELTLWRALTSFLGVNTWTLEHTPAPERPVEMDVISGALFLISKAGFQQLGGFDEGYFLHVEDIDLCARCRDVGGTVMYQPAAGALHYGATSDASSRTIAKHKADGLARYFRRRAKGPFHRAITEVLLPFIRLGLVLRAGD
ncbi:MAG: glycosyltransferase family 2 protein [Pseudomonadota bacterium]